MPQVPTAQPSFTNSKRWLIGLNVLVSIAALLALALMANYLGARHFRRFQVTPDATYELAPLTRQVLEGITNEVQVLVLFDFRNELYSSVSGLLNEYHYANPRIILEKINYVRNPSGAEEARARYKLTTPADTDLVAFKSNGKTKVVLDSELSDYDITGLVDGTSGQARRKAFKGEPLFTSAILSVTDPKQSKAVFLQGHGEHDPESADGLLGYSRFSQVLREKNIRVERSRDAPPDCDLLIIAGPSSPFLPNELEAIDLYLRQGGRLLLLLNNYPVYARRTGLENVLAKWGVAVGYNVVHDPPKTSYTGNDLLVDKFSLHPIVAPLAEHSLWIILPRSISKLNPTGAGADGIKVEELAFTSDQGMTLSEITSTSRAFNPNRDQLGRIPLMAAVEKGSIPGVSADRGSTRIVAVGDSIFLGNETIEKVANRDFAGFAVNWLLDRPQFLGGLGPRPIKEYQIALTREQMQRMRWLMLAALPASVLLLGSLVWLQRRI